MPGNNANSNRYGSARIVKRGASNIMEGPTHKFVVGVSSSAKDVILSALNNAIDEQSRQHDVEKRDLEKKHDDEKKAFEATVQMLKDEVAALQWDMQTKTGEIGDRDFRIEALKVENNEVKEELVAMKVKMENKDTQLADKTSTTDTLKMEKDGLKEEVTAKTMDWWDSNIDALEVEYNSLKARLQIAQGVAETQSSIIDALESEGRSMEHALECDEKIMERELECESCLKKTYKTYRKLQESNEKPFNMANTYYKAGPLKMTPKQTKEMDKLKGTLLEELSGYEEVFDAESQSK
ncbi:hypothetical protein BCR34DRAFT_607451 [Clohesyomyces aquaticus]|uniref:Tropomyosin n=1 Tax=Clohesyomyces aquaticus TaxID=1231657 RepID=A0A1Y1YH29_9PLEO|nr:hypothetical protein BCR34DRAFT_607451 [Clohesyomyces aquaticus]